MVVDDIDDDLTILVFPDLANVGISSLAGLGNKYKTMDWGLVVWFGSLYALLLIFVVVACCRCCCRRRY